MIIYLYSLFLSFSFAASNQIGEIMRKENDKKRE